DDAVVEGLRTHLGTAVDSVLGLHAWIWDAVAACPLEGRVLAAAHVGRPRATDPLLDVWHAVNVLREYRGDTHWAVVVAEGLGAADASILHNAWVGYEGDWIPRSRGLTPADIDAGWRRLEQRGLASGATVLPAGLALRQRIEDRTNALCTVMWEAVGVERSDHFAEILEPLCEILLRRVDETAGTNYQPASRIHPAGHGTAREPRR
ncbi:MAG: hypothetical protein M3Q68_04675, partial [Actinomycetota bacterium]|nr:hypothetical protein [Actinomycetota bacterium]